MTDEFSSGGLARILTLVFIFVQMYPITIPCCERVLRFSTGFSILVSVMQMGGWGV